MHKLIYGHALSQRFTRHVLFWICQLAFWIFYATSFSAKFTLDYVKEKTAINCYFIFDILYTYGVAYLLLPLFIDKRKYVKAGTYLLLLTIACYILYVGFHLWSNGFYFKSQGKKLLNIWYLTTTFIFNGPLAACGMFLTFKMLKNYFIQVKKHKQLTKENAHAELQLLNAQIHPHFLFNTLNNIYSFTLNRSSETAGLVLKLKDTINYMAYECDTPQVPLEKEVKMLEDYIGLEKIRYGNRLDIVMNTEGNFENKKIAPLLMIPFVENCFKHGISKTIDNAWIRLDIKAGKDTLYFTISNSITFSNEATGKNGIGLSNVKKRLDLLYSNNYSLNIKSSENVYTVQLQVPLQINPSPAVPDNLIQHKTVTHASV
ncbi:MAG: histidine kinase [Ferruginibacter sp.]